MNTGLFWVTKKIVAVCVCISFFVTFIGNGFVYAQEQVKCSACGKLNPSRAKFCGSCGNALQPKSTPSAGPKKSTVSSGSGSRKSGIFGPGFMLSIALFFGGIAATLYGFQDVAKADVESTYGWQYYTSSRYFVGGTVKNTGNLDLTISTVEISYDRSPYYEYVYPNRKISPGSTTNWEGYYTFLTPLPSSGVLVRYTYEKSYVAQNSIIGWIGVGCMLGGAYMFRASRTYAKLRENGFDIRLVQNFDRTLLLASWKFAV